MNQRASGARWEWKCNIPKLKLLKSSSKKAIYGDKSQVWKRPKIKITWYYISWKYKTNKESPKLAEGSTNHDQNRNKWKKTRQTVENKSVKGILQR